MHGEEEELHLTSVTPSPVQVGFETASPTWSFSKGQLLKLVK